MKKVGKLLIGVLSVGALIGTGYAAWTVNGGYVSNDGEIPFEIATIGSKEMSLEVTEKDTSEKVVFDAPKEWHGNEHLTKTYNVKAIKGVDLVDTPYACAANGYWNLVSKPYQPHLKISTVAIDKETKEALTGTRLTKLESYIALPKDEVVDYKTWLKSELETTGYEYTFTFSWTSGVNPQIAWKDLAASEQTKNFTDLNKAFDGVAFKYTIQVGGVNEDTPIPGETYTGEVTIPTVANASLTVNGLVDGKLTAGKHDITLTLDEGKVLKDDALYINTDKVVMTKVDPTGKLASGKGYTYTCNYDFKEGVNYTFKYEVENEVTPTKKTTFTYTESELVYIDFNLEDHTKVLPGDLLDVGTEVYFDLLVEDGYTYETYFNGTLLDDISFVLVEGTNNFEVRLTKEEPPVKTYKVNVTGEHITFNYSIDITKELPLGTEVTFTYTVEEGYELKSLTFNGVDVKETKKFTVVADKNELVATTELIPVKNYTLNEILVENKTTVTGKIYNVSNVKVVAVNQQGFTIYDGTAYLEVYLAKAPEFVVGDYISIEGEVKKNFGWCQFTNTAAFTKLDKFEEIADQEAVEFTYADLMAREDDDQLGVKKVVFTAKYKAKPYKGFYFDEGTARNIGISYYDLSSFIDGATYKVTAILNDWGNAAGTFIRVSYISSEKIADPVVEDVKVTGITVASTDISLEEGATKAITATVTPDNATNQEVIYKSTDETIATVDEKGVVTGVKEGTTTVTVTSKENAEITATVNITVTKKSETPTPSEDKITTYTFKVNKDDKQGGKGSSLWDDFADKTAGDDLTKNVTLTSGFHSTAHGARFGAKSTKGSLSFELTISCKKIIVSLMPWPGDSTNVLVNGGNEINLTEKTELENYEVSFDTPTSTVTLESKIKSKNRFYISSITFIY
ncbi:MAG: Ig-like domain-containing protein [Mollicutes bacterium]|nr:Ig-like domain-containing protein [Mollicutes bacterium]MDD7264113.1 Ig-like domain-containing protein [bacterium]MDY4979184.1 Ig-like domain-containing protein [Candidatus Onthovivens sp.]